MGTEVGTFTSNRLTINPKKRTVTDLYYELICLGNIVDIGRKAVSWGPGTLMRVEYCDMVVIISINICLHSKCRPMLDFPSLTHPQEPSTAAAAPPPRRSAPSVEAPAGRWWSERYGTPPTGLRTHNTTAITHIITVLRGDKTEITHIKSVKYQLL